MNGFLIRFLFFGGIGLCLLLLGAGGAFVMKWLFEMFGLFGGMAVYVLVAAAFAAAVSAPKGKTSGEG